MVLPGGPDFRAWSGKPGSAYAAPQCGVTIEGVQLRDEVARLIQSVEYESADGIADVAKVKLTNPDGKLTDLKLFQVGNAMSIFGGYAGSQLEHIGRVRLAAPTFHFPKSGEPSIELVGYTRDHEMMDNSPDKDATRPNLRTKAQRDAAKRVYKTPMLSEVLKDKAATYGFRLDAPVDFKFQQSIVQKAGVSDYDLVKGLSNLAGFVFWVDGDQSGTWTMHCVPADKLRQPTQLTLKYRMGDDSSLLGFRPQLALRDTRTRIKCVVRNEVKGETYEATFEDDASESPDVAVEADLEATLDKSYLSGGAVKLYFGEHSIDVITNKVFGSKMELRRWAEQWFRRNRENFIVGEVETVGLPTIMARQVHLVEGVSLGLDGRYYFTRVAHKFNREGYMLDITAHKMVKNVGGSPTFAPARTPAADALPEF